MQRLRRVGWVPGRPPVQVAQGDQMGQQEKALTRMAVSAPLLEVCKQRL